MLFLRYVKDRWFFFFLFLLFSGVLFLFFFLENLYLQVAVDIFLWFFLIFALSVGTDFFRYRKKHRHLLQMIRSPEDEILSLPKSESAVEDDYQIVIDRITERFRDLETQTDRQKVGMNDYYTLWVHQIKIPLSALRLMLETDPDTRQISQMEEELVRIEHYLDMLLHFFRLESMSSDLLITTNPLDEIVREAVKKSKNVFIRKKISLRMDIPSIPVLTDRKWLSFILEQLLSNSLKYTKSGEISIYIDPAPPQTLVLEDTGIGIPAEDLPRIGERGFTGYNGRVHQKASGLGLYMCRKIAERLSLSLSVYSEQGKGTRVSIRFPDEKIEQL